MSDVDGDRREATAIFKLGLKASKAGIHRTLNRGLGAMRRFTCRGHVSARKGREQTLAENPAPCAQAAELGLARVTA